MIGVVEVNNELLQAAERAAEKLEWSHAADILARAEQTDVVLDRRSFCLSKAKRYPEAIEALAELRRRQPDHFRPYYSTGYQHYQQGLYAEAIPWFDEALKRKADHLKSLWRKAYALKKTGRHMEAKHVAGKLLRLWSQLSPDRQKEEKKLAADASRLLGKAYLSNNPQLAIPLLEQAVQLDPDDCYKQYCLGKALRLVGNPSQAFEHLRRATELKPDDIYIQLEMAAATLSSGKPDAAKTLLNGLAGRCRGWQTVLAGQLASKAGDAALALNLLRHAQSDRAIRNHPRVKRAFDAAQSAAGIDPPRARDEASRPVDVSTGRVAVARPDRGFGFLVDDKSGVRRHFRMKAAAFNRGDRVRFTPIDAEKGPAAKDVTRL